MKNWETGECQSTHDVLLPRVYYLQGFICVPIDSRLSHACMHMCMYVHLPFTVAQNVIKLFTGFTRLSYISRFCNRTSSFREDHYATRISIDLADFYRKKNFNRINKWIITNTTRNTRTFLAMCHRYRYWVWAYRQCPALYASLLYRNHVEY